MGAVLALILWTTNAPAVAPLRAAYVVSSNDDQVARVDLDTGQVDLGLFSVGSLANRIELFPSMSSAAVVNSGSDDLTLLDLGTESVTSTISLPAGTNPWTVELAGSRVFVSSLLRDLVYEVDPDAAAVIDTAVVGVAPEGMCVANDRLYVANTAFDFDDFTYGPGTVSVLDLADLSTVATISVGTNPQECFVAPDGRVHVVCTGDFFLATGSVHVVDPIANTVVDSLSVGGYPGDGAVHEDGIAYLNVTTLAFGSQVWAYDTVTLGFVFDGASPLLPSLSFYGGLQVTTDEFVLVPDFSSDLLLVEDSADPGNPEAYLVGDGPIDVAVVEREGPVPLLLSGLTISNVEEGVRLSWRATVDVGIESFVIDRGPAVGSWERLASGLPISRENEYTDRSAQSDRRYAYRVGAVRGGEIDWLPGVTLVRRRLETRRLAIHNVFPNPSRATVSFEVSSPSSAPGRLELIDVRGRRVRTLEVARVTTGLSRIGWDGRNDRGSAVAPGLYYARLSVGAETVVERVLRIR